CGPAYLVVKGMNPTATADNNANAFPVPLLHAISWVAAVAAHAPIIPRIRPAARYLSIDRFTRSAACDHTLWRSHAHRTPDSIAPASPPLSRLHCQSAVRCNRIREGGTLASPNPTEEGPQPAARSARPPATIEQSPGRGRRYETLGWVALAFGAAGIGVQVGEATTSDLVIWIIGAVLTVVGAWAILRGRQHLAPVLPSLQSLPPGERTVLFLRAFNADATFFRPVAARFYWLRSVLTGQPTTAADLQTEEQQIATAVASFGRMVALGNPSETLPPLGAQRSYADDHTWQAEVL